MKGEMNMGTLRQVRFALKADKELRKMMVRGNRNEILLDINDDREAEIALQDINSDGNIDRLAFDVTGDGWYDLFIDDTDRNGIPDRIFTVITGDDETPDKVEEIAAGPELEALVIEDAKKLLAFLEMREIAREELDLRLKELDRDVRRMRRELR